VKVYGLIPSGLKEIFGVTLATICAVTAVGLLVFAPSASYICDWMHESIVVIAAPTRIKAVG